jgi:calreticulin
LIICIFDQYTFSPDIKPEDWEQPEHVADPDATKPEDWDDEMDGEWEPPMIDNPDYKV